MSAETKVKTRPPDDIFEALETLSPTDKARLQKIAQSYARIMGVEWEDLYSEALTRTLEGRRNCPAGVDPVAFFVNVMKGIKSDNFRAGKRRHKHGFEEISQGDLLDLHANDTAPSPEDCIIAKQTDAEWVQCFERLFESFEGDDEIQFILLGMNEGLEGAALREEIGLDEKTYHSARRRLRRKIESGTLNGLIS